MNLPPFPSLPSSPQERLRWIAWGEEYFRAGMERAAQIADGLDCAHKCRVGSEVAAAIRAELMRLGQADAR